MEHKNSKEAKLQQLQAAIDEADKSGEPVPLDIEKIIASAEKRRTDRKNRSTEQDK